MSSCSARFCEKSSSGFCEDADQVGQALDHRLALAELVGVVEVGEVAAGEPGVGVDQRLDDLRVDLVADVALALERDHVLEARALRDGDRRGEVVAVAVLVGDVLDEQHEQDVVLVLAGIHAAAQLVAGGPEGGVEVGFLDGHGLIEFSLSSVDAVAFHATRRVARLVDLSHRPLPRERTSSVRKAPWLESGASIPPSL